MSNRVLLIVAGYYPSSMPGAHRAAKLVKYLPQSGWTPTVVCADWTPANSDGSYDPLLAGLPDVCRTVRVFYPTYPATKLRRGIWCSRERLFPYGTPHEFYRGLLAAAGTVAAAERFDCIWASFTPGAAIKVAGLVARRGGVPWVADFRDLPDADVPGWRLRHFRRREVAACRGVSVISTVTQPLADILASRHRAPVRVVPNGFDPDEYQAEAACDKEKFRICYTGQLYKGWQDPRPLFEALDRLDGAGQADLDDICIDFYGADKAQVAASAEGYRCGRVVACHGRIPHFEAIRRQQAAAVLLLLSVAAVSGVMTSKIFGYLGARRPILDIPGGDVTRSMMVETRAGVSASTPGEVAAAVANWYDEWKRTGTVAFGGLEDRIARYSRVGQAAEFARIFDSVSRR